jgi:hypothetical protein
MNVSFFFFFLCKDKPLDLEVQEISPSEDEEKSAPKFQTQIREPSKMEQELGVKLTTSEPQLGSSELTSPNVTHLNMSGQNKTIKNSLKKSKKKFFATLSAATSWITQKPSVTFTRPETACKKYKGTASSEQQDDRSISVSLLSQGLRYDDRGQTRAQLHWATARVKLAIWEKTVSFLSHKMKFLPSRIIGYVIKTQDIWA